MLTTTVTHNGEVFSNGTFIGEISSDSRSWISAPRHGNDTRHATRRDALAALTAAAR